MEVQQLELFYLNLLLDVSNILITPIKIDGTHYCLQDDGLTVPILSGSPVLASTTPKVGPTAGGPTLTGDNIFNVYQALGNTNPSFPANQFRDNPARSGGIKFGVHQCAESIDIRVVGRADVYGAGFDTLTITIDGVQEAFFQSIDDGSSGPPFDQVTSYDQTVSKTFSTDIPCGHIVDISGVSGTFANNNVGYDVKITVTLPT
tara:strand:- start:1436 stop:2047 length:612 start_codon:yes stop_codon:yes gene_type:complete